MATRPALLLTTAALLVAAGTAANVGKDADARTAGVDVRRVDGLLVIESLGGRLRIWTPGGRGTRLRAELPCG
jgi:hypothetical protein